MKVRPGAVIGLVAALLLTGCGAKDSAAPKAKASASASRSAPAPTEAQLKSALLTVADLPAGYKVDPSASTADDDGATSDNPACTDTFKGFEKATLDKDAPHVEAGFTGGENGPFLIQSLVGLDGDEASEEFALFRDSLRKCTTWTETDRDGTKTTNTLAPMAFAKFGDDTESMKLTLNKLTLTVTANFIVVRVGGTLCVLMHLGVPAVAAADTEALVRKATEKIDRATG